MSRLGIKRSGLMSNANEQSLTDLANAAFVEAAKEVVKRASETGTPVIVWRMVP